MTPTVISLYLRMFLASLPTAVVCLGACIIILGKLRTGSPWATWALMGFGLGLVTTIAIPVTQASMQAWVVQSHNAGSIAWIFTALAFFWSFLHACAYALIFVAVLEGRK
jgi:hypothetical protein